MLGEEGGEYLGAVVVVDAGVTSVELGVVGRCQEGICFGLSLGFQLRVERLLGTGSGAAEG